MFELFSKKTSKNISQELSDPKEIEERLAAMVADKNSAKFVWYLKDIEENYKNWNENGMPITASHIMDALAHYYNNKSGDYREDEYITDTNSGLEVTAVSYLKKIYNPLFSKLSSDESGVNPNCNEYLATKNHSLAKQLFAMQTLLIAQRLKDDLKALGHTLDPKIHRKILLEAMSIAVHGTGITDVMLGGCRIHPLTLIGFRSGVLYKTINYGSSDTGKIISDLCGEEGWKDICKYKPIGSPERNKDQDSVWTQIAEHIIIESGKESRLAASSAQSALTNTHP